MEPRVFIFLLHQRDSPSNWRVIEWSGTRLCLLINAAAGASLRNVIFWPAWPELLSSKISLMWNTLSLKTIINIRHLPPSHSNLVIYCDLLTGEMCRRKLCELVHLSREPPTKDTHWDGHSWCRWGVTHFLLLPSLIYVYGGTISIITIKVMHKGNHY